jgi:hypothetical protein
MPGAIALGGGEFTVVSVVDLVLEFEVDSVTMAWAIAADIPIMKVQLTIIRFIHIWLLGYLPSVFTEILAILITA